MTVWVWRPYVARRHLTLIHGPRHAGKSYVAMIIAAAVVDGATLAGIPAANKGLLNRPMEPKHFHIEPSASNKYRSKSVWKSEQSAHACESA